MMRIGDMCQYLFERIMLIVINKLISYCPLQSHREVNHSVSEYVIVPVPQWLIRGIVHQHRIHSPLIEIMLVTDRVSE
jgi:hypothetical protein